MIHHKEFLCRLGSRSPGRLRLPFAATRPQPPELARPGVHAARHARVRRRSTSELGGRGERYSHSQRDPKVADIAATALKMSENASLPDAVRQEALKTYRRIHEK